MKKQFLFLSILFIASFSMMAQTDQTAPKAQTDFVPSGAPILKVFFNYSDDQTQNAVKKSAFNVDRAYLGYKYDLSSTISTKVVFDVTNTNANTAAVGTAYVAFLKVAQLDWKVAPSVKLSMGMIGLKQFDDQEDFWGYRYMFKSFNDQNGFGSSADLGINAEVKLAKTLKFNFLVVNGEGYKAVQDAKGKQKVGGSLVFTPVKGLITKIYFDSQAGGSATTGATQINTLALFAGYKMDSWRFAAEYNQLNNGKSYTSSFAGYNLSGFSLYTTYALNKKLEVLARYDQLKSNTLSGATNSWNATKDGGQVIGGLQYAPVKGFKLAFNYQGYNYTKAVTGSTPNTSKYFLSAEFSL